MKGHQIIGELRHPVDLGGHAPNIEGSPDHWWVTTEVGVWIVVVRTLKGHQIIGELRLYTVTNSFVNSIEGSPDHWWVTTESTEH